MKEFKLSLGLAALIAAFSSTTFAYTVEGTVSDEGGQAVSGAKVSLLKEGKSAQKRPTSPRRPKSFSEKPGRKG